MPRNEYYPGTLVSLSGIFTTPDGSGYDPSVVTVRYRPYNVPQASASAHTYGIGSEVVRVGTGRYYCQVVLPTAYENQYFFYDWWASGQAVQQGQLFIRNSQFF